MNPCQLKAVSHGAVVTSGRSNWEASALVTPNEPAAPARGSPARCTCNELLLCYGPFRWAMELSVAPQCMTGSGRWCNSLATLRTMYALGAGARLLWDPRGKSSQVCSQAATCSGSEMWCKKKPTKVLLFFPVWGGAVVQKCSSQLHVWYPGSRSRPLPEPRP